MVFLQNLPETVSGYVSLHNTYIDIHLLVIFLPVHKKSFQSLPSHHLPNMQIPPKVSSVLTT